MSHGRRSGPAWERAVREHRGSLATFVATVERYDPDAWRQPLGTGRWAPAQVADHLARVYEALLREAGGAPPMRPLAGPVVQRLLRWIVLPHLLFHRSIPLRASAPRETRPDAAGLDPKEAVRALTELADRVEHHLSDLTCRAVTHPYFGRLSPERALRFCAAHMDHHHRQIAGSRAKVG